MTQETKNLEQYFFSQFSDLFELYVVVKEAIIIAENYAKDQKIYIAPLNQLRSALDHVFKATQGDIGQIEYEIKEAREHIVRAGYDAYEVVASTLGLKIQERLSKYSTETLSSVFPSYYQEMKPKLVDIQAVLGKIRTAKNGVDEEIPVAFEKYFEELQEIIRIERETIKMIPVLEEYQNRIKKEKRKETRKNRVWQISIAILTLILGFVLRGYVKLPGSDDKTQTPTPEQVEKPALPKADDTAPKNDTVSGGQS